MNPVPTAPASLRFDQGSLLLTGVGEQDSRDIFTPDIWAWDGRVPAWRCHAMHYGTVAISLQDRIGSLLADEVARSLTIHWHEINLPVLRLEQQDALAAWRAAGCRGQIIMPTGTGKTEVALAAMAETRIATLIVAPVRDLIPHFSHRNLIMVSTLSGKRSARPAEGE